MLASREGDQLPLCSARLVLAHLYLCESYRTTVPGVFQLVLHNRTCPQGQARGGVPCLRSLLFHTAPTTFCTEQVSPMKVPHLTG